VSKGSKNKDKPKIKQSKLYGKRILAWCDSPRVATGFGVVAREILTGLAEKGALIDVIGINDLGGWYAPQIFPFRIYPAMPGASPGGDVYGRQTLVAALMGDHTEITPPWDLIWVLGDHFILEQAGPGVLEHGSSVFLRRAVEEWKKHDIDTKLVFYTPVDSPLKENWVTRAIAPFDRIVSYTEYGVKEILKACPVFETDQLKEKIDVIPHGVDLAVFKPSSSEDLATFKEKYFGDWLKPEDFLIVNVNRNQPRKDLSRTLEVFRRFQQRVPDAKLYLHCAVQDAGGSIQEMARCLNLDMKLVKLPTQWHASNPFPQEFMNLLYNSADAVISTTMGEGWGLSLTEAMSASRPVVFHNVTSISEILGLEPNTTTVYDETVRGLGVRSSDMICLGIGDLERVRPIASIDDFVSQLVWIYENEDKALEMGARARAWLVKSELSWKSVVSRWEKLLIEELEKNIEKPVALQEVPAL